ncbi:hypothetical protein ABK040_002262 [Willaertia magna]
MSQQPTSCSCSHHHHEEQQVEELDTNKHTFNDPADEFRSFSDEELKQIIADDNNAVSKRSRLLYYLRQLTNNEEEIERSISILSEGFKSNSALLRHEIAYVMGQIGSEKAIPILEKVIQNLSEDVMVRHEAGEALGAIGSEQALPVLEQYLKDEHREIRETCELAIENIKYRQIKLKALSSVQNSLGNSTDPMDSFLSPFSSVDPSPAFESDKKLIFEEIKSTFLDLNKPLFERYKAMFTLRNIAGQYLEIDQKDYMNSWKRKEEALQTLCKGLLNKDEGALFKHEVAFVLGQLQDKSTANALEEILRDKNQHAMVRHEAAEALGSISDPESLKLLQEFEIDDVSAVKDSCTVAIDMHEYWSKFFSLTKSENEEQE